MGSIWDTEDAYAVDTTQLGIAGSIGVLVLDAIIGGVVGVVVLAIKIAAIIKEIINIILEYARR